MNKKWEQASWTCLWNLQYWSLLIHMSCCVQQQAKRNCHPLFRHTFCLWYYVRHLHRLSLGMKLSWNVSGQLWLLFCCSGQANTCRSICHFAKISCSVRLLFPSKKKSDVFRTQALFMWEPWLLYISYFFFFFGWIQSCLTVCIELGFVTKVKWFSCIWKGRQLLYYGINNIVCITVSMK